MGVGTRCKCIWMAARCRTCVHSEALSSIRDATSPDLRHNMLADVSLANQIPVRMQKGLRESLLTSVDQTSLLDNNQIINKKIRFCLSPLWESFRSLKLCQKNRKMSQNLAHLHIAYFVWLGVKPRNNNWKEKQTLFYFIIFFLIQMNSVSLSFLVWATQTFYVSRWSQGINILV